ncbi:hypothetical protein V1277_005553 [Bradyrhizobium sp. AZCC 1588]|uniref:isochorismatase family protein n=1 Tax=unclassified Bradyrhizobium TaxID=2631580 RepID=UPI002FF24824
MLAHPGQSAVLLLNPSRLLALAETTGGSDHKINLRLLALGCRMLGVCPLSLGDCEPEVLSAIAPDAFQIIPIDGLLLWNDQSFVERLARNEPRFLVLAGACLEEEVLLAALEAVRRGYDVRVLADLSVARREAERKAVFDRLALHGVLVTTVRQTLLEWAVSVGDASLMQEIRKLLE